MAQRAMQECSEAVDVWNGHTAAWRMYIELAMEKALRPDLAQAACKNADISTRPVATRRASAIDTARGSSLQLLALAAARNRRNRLTSM